MSRGELPPIFSPLDEFLGSPYESRGLFVGWREEGVQVGYLINRIGNLINCANFVFILELDDDNKAFIIFNIYFFLNKYLYVTYLSIQLL